MAEVTPEQMIDQTQPVAPPGTSHWLRAAILHRVLAAALLTALVLFGLFLTNYSHLDARFYWTAMFPIFGLVSTWQALRTRHPVMAVWRILLREAAHWLGAMLAVRVIFLQLEWGQMDADSAALMTVLLLAVTCFLAGVHLDHSFIWISLLLAATAIIGTNIEGYLWLIVVLALIALGIAAAAATMIHRHRRAEAAPPAALT